MNFIKNVWQKFRQLKLWLQIVIGFVLLSLIGSITGGGSTSTDSSTSQTTNSSSTSTEASSEATAPVVSDAEFKAAMSRMKIKKDSVRGINFYRDLTSPKYVNQNGFNLYVGSSKGSTPSLFWEIQYEGDDWLFIQSYLFNVDGYTYEFSPEYGEVNSDNDSRVWEWYNEAITDEQIDLIQRIIKSKSAVMRLNGRQYYKDVKISETQKEALQRVLTVFQGLGGDLTNP
jgi:hypothetical protein